MMCIFCKIIENKITCYKIYEDENILAILDVFPIEKGHVLIISKKHYENILQLDPKTLQSSVRIIAPIYKKIQETFHCDGFNLFTNTHEIAGQEILHFHWHIIPRYQEHPKKFTTKRLEFSREQLLEIKKKLKL